MVRVRVRVRVRIRPKIDLYPYMRFEETALKRFIICPKIQGLRLNA